MLVRREVFGLPDGRLAADLGERPALPSQRFPRGASSGPLNSSSAQAYGPAMSRPINQLVAEPPARSQADSRSALRAAPSPLSSWRPATTVSRLVDSAAACCFRACPGGRSFAPSGEVHGLFSEPGLLCRGGPGDPVGFDLRSRCNGPDLVSQTVASTSLSCKRRRPPDHRSIRTRVDSSRDQARGPAPGLHESQGCCPGRIGWRPVSQPVVATPHGLALRVGSSRRRLGPRPTRRSAR